MQGLRPEIAYIAPDSLASKAGLQVGDQIRAIAGKDILLSSDAHIALVGAPRRSDVNLVIQRDGEERILALDLSGLRAGDELKMDEATGLYLVDEWLPANVAEAIADGPAAARASQKATALPPPMAKRKTSSASAKSSPTANRARISPLPSCARATKQTLHGKLGSRTDKKGQEHGFLGVKWQPVDVSAYQTVERYGVWASLGHGWDKVVYYVRLT